MSRPFAVEGFEVTDLLAVGAGSEVWRARELRTGEQVALKRMAGPVDAAAQERLLREAASLGGLAHPHVLQLRAVLEHEGGVVLVLDLADGGSLAGLVAARGRLTPAEVVTVGVAVAGALAAVHAVGLVHGDVTPANVLLTADGRPLLADLGEAGLRAATPAVPGQVSGTPGYLDPGGDRGPAGDVHGLAATCLAALRGSPPYDHAGPRRPPGATSDVPASPGTDPVTALLEQVLAATPADRPAAAALAVALFDAHPAGPLVLPASSPRARCGQAAAGGVEADLAPPTRRSARPVPPPAVRPMAQRGGSHRRPAAHVATGGWIRARQLPWRAVAAAALATSGLIGAAAAGLAWAGTGASVLGGSAGGPVAATLPVTPGPAAPLAQHPAQSPVGPSLAADWLGVLAALDRERAVAFAEGDERRLREVYAPGSPAGRRDRAALRRLVAQALVAHGVQVGAREVTVAGRDEHGVRLRVRDVLGAYRLVDRSGVVVAERSGRGPAWWSVTLRRGARGWQVYDVLRL